MRVTVGSCYAYMYECRVHHAIGWTLLFLPEVGGEEEKSALVEGIPLRLRSRVAGVGRPSDVAASPESCGPTVAAG